VEFKTPTGPRRHANPQHDPAQLTPLFFGANLERDDTDSIMQNPDNDANFFSQPTTTVDWSEDPQIARLSKVRSLVKDLLNEINTAKKEEYLDFIIEDTEVEDHFVQLARVLPSYTTNYQLKPIFTGIEDLQKMVVQMAGKLDKVTSQAHSQSDKSLQGSIHTTTRNTSITPEVHALHPIAPARNPQSAKQTVVPSKETATPRNPSSSHHPSRLVVQFLPNGLPVDRRLDPSEIVSRLNTDLASKSKSTHMKVVAANFNNQGNLIISTRSDQTAAELLKFQDEFTPSLALLGGNRDFTLREDKKWFKVQIDGVNTSSFSIGNERVANSAEAIQNELLTCNPLYAKFQNLIVAKPRWLRTSEELLSTPRSSLVFALTDESAARQLLYHRSLAAFGRHCSIRAFQDRPPVTQCRNCWRLDHNSHQCKEAQRCRICGGGHEEKDHHSDPSDCAQCITAQNNGDQMDTTADGRCIHEFRCLNCLGDSNKDHSHPADARRCPSRLEKYGTARENERRAQKSENPWVRAKPKKSKPKTATLPKPTFAVSNNNKFDPIAPTSSQHNNAQAPPHPSEPATHPNIDPK
jgi:hypothetical protein